MGIKLNTILASPLCIGLLYRFVRCYAWTFRLRIENEDAWMTHIENGGRVLLCAWHQQFFSAIRHFRNYRRFSPGMKSVIDGLKASCLAGHIVDGPRGPAGVVKAGVIRIAHATDAAIVPFYVAADKAWYFNSWDRFMLPKPFSRVLLRFGKLVHLDPTDDEALFEAQRVALECMMRPGLIA